MNRFKYASLLWKHNTVMSLKAHKNLSSKLAKPFSTRENNESILNNKCNVANFNDTERNKQVKCHRCHSDISVDVVPFNCQNCKALITIDVFKIFNFFELFDIREVNYDIDKNYLRKKFNDIQKIYHPDRNSQNQEIEKINEVSSYLNHAYRVLSNDVDRAIYLMNIQYDYKIAEEENLEDDEFLFEIVQINEEINNPDANIASLTKEYKEKYEDYVGKIKLYFKEKDFNSIVNSLKKLKFINKVLERLQNL
ncbi:chaperone, putative [Plasmodium ovale]|uniref:Chaperone, putative n=1 Tax=Plasmodium ovale TaxID=36330 RepID=A0A1C3KQN9_PLAOA|nr:chaperone, putative [Plasmodium ovale]